MLATYGAFLALIVASALVGQALLVIAGRRAWSPLAPAVGLAALLALAWGTVRLPGEGTAAAIALGAAVLGAAGVVAARRPEGPAIATGELILTALGALFLASLPFLVEGRFGILGTGLNPDMSQHLFAADRLASDGVERLISEGYPLGPHALCVALTEIGPNSVEAFSGLMLVIAVAAALVAHAALACIARRPLRIAGALVVAFAYLLASNHIQGAFKEGLEALFVLAFVVALAETSSAPRTRLAATPPAVLAVGAVYSYSFPGLLWIAGALGLWLGIRLAPDLLSAERRAGALAALRGAAVPGAVALGVFAVASAPEIGRMISFASFETFDPDGPGLGNLFKRLSPLEALGIWPSGDFRVEPGDGAAPALVFWIGAALGAGALAYGIRCARGPDGAPVLAAFAAAVVLWLYSLIVGTAYQEAKALVILAPLVALLGVRALGSRAPVIVSLAFIAAAGGSGALALANGPVGPSGYTPELGELRDDFGSRSVVVYAPRELLAEQHGRDWLVWELRGNRICVEELPAGEPALASPAGASILTVSLDEEGAVVPEGLYRTRTRARGEEPCPFVADGARADPGGDG